MVSSVFWNHKRQIQLFPWQKKNHMSNVVDSKECPSKKTTYAKAKVFLTQNVRQRHTILQKESGEYFWILIDEKYWTMDL